MFTGLIEETGILESIQINTYGAVLTIKCNKITNELTIGASISINGACHTVIAYTKTSFTVQTSKETLNISNFKNLTPGTCVNLERAMNLNSRLDGHLVSGHIDGTAEFLYSKADGFSNKLFFKTTPQLAKYIIYKGSITINGISLTIAYIENEVFAVEIIPHTMEQTNLKELNSGDIVNIETDMIAKYVEKFLQVGNNTTKITKSFLEENGFL